MITGPPLSLALCPLPANTGSRPPEKFTWVAGREAVRAAKEWHAGADLPALRQGTQGPATRYSLGEARASRGRQRLARAGGRRPAAHAHAAHGQGATPGSHRERGQPCALLGPVSAGVRLWGTPPCSASTVHRDDGHASWRWVSNKAVVCILTPAAECSTGPCCAEQVPYRRMDTGGRRRRPSPIHKPAGAPSPLRALVSAPWLAPARSLSTEPPATMSFSRRGQQKVNRSERRVATLAKK